jgi:sulfur dioxygenase
MELKLTQLNPHSCKTYMIQANGSKDIVLIDPVLEHFREYWALIREKGLNLTHVIDTHTHADHISGAAALKDVYGCEYVMQSEAPAHCVTFRVHDGFEWKLSEEIPVRVIHTPGHTQDSICLILDGILLTGDTLFLDDGGAGRDDLPGGDPDLPWESLRKLASLPGELVVYPAHDYRNRVPSSLTQQKKTNPYFTPSSKREFTQYLEDLRLGPADWMKEELIGELGHLAGIVHVPIGSLAHPLHELKEYRNREIVTICRSGARAYTAAQILKKAGFPAVSVLNGGMIAVRTSKRRMKR